MKIILCFFIVSFITLPFLCAQETHPLKDAIKQENLSVVQTLLDDGGDTIKALLATSAAINQVDASSQWTRLMYAVAQGHNEAFDALLTAQADVQATNAAGWTALHLATLLGHSDLSSHLIEAGAKENARNELGHTPNQLAQIGLTYRDTQLMKAGAR
jgi:ankyrin repeat protein